MQAGAPLPQGPFNPPPCTHLGQVGPDGLDLIVKDVVLLHLLVHQRQVRPEALAAQLVLAREAGGRHAKAWARRPRTRGPPGTLARGTLALPLTAPAEEAVK